MQTLQLKSYWRRNWLPLLVIFIISFAIGQLSHPLPHILFFIIFFYIFFHKLQEHNNQVKLDYMEYGAAVYRVEKINNDILKSLDNLQTIGLVIAAKNTYFAKYADKELLTQPWFKEKLWRKLDEIKITHLTEKVIVILQEAKEICLTNPMDNNQEYHSLLLWIENLETLILHGYKKTKPMMPLDVSIITEQLILDNKKIYVPDCSEVFHCVQAVISLLLLHRERTLVEIGDILEDLKKLIISTVEGELIDSKNKIGKYLKM